MPEVLHSDSEMIVAAGDRWQRPIGAEFQQLPSFPDSGNVRWCPNVYEALAEAVSLKRQGGAGVVCVMVDYLSGAEMGVFKRLGDMAHINRVIAFSVSANGGKLLQAQELGADETWILGKAPVPAAQDIPKDADPEHERIEALERAPAQAMEAEPPAPDEPARSSQPLLTKEELDALLG